MGRNDITDGNDYVILNEYTDPDIFEKKQKEIKQQCDESIRVYCEKKKQNLQCRKISYYKSNRNIIKIKIITYIEQ